jgi:hypothetical protein
MPDLTNSKRTQRDAGFQRSQRRPDGTSERTEADLRETFEQAVANRFGEEIGVDLHDISWKSIPKRYKSLAGFVGATKLAMHGAGTLISESAQLFQQAKNAVANFKDVAWQESTTNREANDILESLIRRRGLHEDFVFNGRLSGDGELNLKLVIGEFLIQLYDVLLTSNTSRQEILPGRLLHSLSSMPKVVEIRDEYLNILKDEAALRWIHAQTLVSATELEEQSDTKHYQVGLMLRLANQCDVPLANSFSKASPEELIQCLTLMSFAIHGVDEVVIRIEGHPFDD